MRWHILGVIMAVLAVALSIGTLVFDAGGDRDQVRRNTAEILRLDKIKEDRSAADSDRRGEMDQIQQIANQQREIIRLLLEGKRR